ncbi:hypothetical protein V5799_007917, partial [Amblyomma americanum]
MEGQHANGRATPRRRHDRFSRTFLTCQAEPPQPALRRETLPEAATNDRFVREENFGEGLIDSGGFGIVKEDEDKGEMSSSELPQFTRDVSPF